MPGRARAATRRRGERAWRVSYGVRGGGGARGGAPGLQGRDEEVGAGAAAEVPGQHLADLLPRRLGPLAEEGTDAHDDSPGATGALEAGRWPQSPPAPGAT